MSFGVCTDIGHKRKENQDNFCALPQYGLYALADGMGGHENGKYASNLALEILVKEIEKEDLSHFDLAQLEDVFEKVNVGVYQTQQHTQTIMGTTLSAIVIDKDCFRMGHIGDSRVYLYRKTEFVQLSNDHSYFAEAQKYASFNQSIQKESTQNVLTRAIGPEAEISGQYITKELYPNDLLLLCTDGLYKAVSEIEILNILSRYTDVQKMCDELLNLALKNDSNDNITILIYQHDGK